MWYKQAVFYQLSFARARTATAPGVGGGPPVYG
jgi:hypothetical protein